MKNDQLQSILVLSFILNIPLFELFLRAALDIRSPLRIIDESAREVGTEEALISALSDPSISVITLVTDIIVINNLEVNRDVIIDFNHCKIASLTQSARVIDLKSGSLVLTGKGSIVANGLNSSTVRIQGAMTPDNSNYSNLFVDEDITLYAPNYYGLFVAPHSHAAYGVQIDFQGGIIARDGICINSNVTGTGDHAASINVLDGARITVDENEGFAVYAAGYGKWHVGAAEFIGATGIGIRSGELALDGTNIIASGDFNPHPDWDEGMTSIGAVVQLDSSSEENPPEISVLKGQYYSRQGYIFAKPNFKSILNTFEVKGGTFVDSLGIFYGFAPNKAEGALSPVLGGSYNHDISNYLSSHRHLEQSASKKYQVQNDLVTENLDPATLFSNAETELQHLVEMAEFYLSPDYTSDELGELQNEIDKALNSLRRARNGANKLLHTRKSVTIEQLKGSAGRLTRALNGVKKIEDDLRTEIVTVNTSAREIDPRDYSRYSYNLLMNSVEDAEIMLIQKHVTLTELYSAFCDVNLNLDLLVEPEADEDTFVPSPLPEPTPESPLELKSFIDSVKVTSLLSNLETVPEVKSPLPSNPDPEPLAAVEPDPVDLELQYARQSLSQLITNLSSLNPSDYTHNSYDLLQNTINAATSLLGEPDSELGVDLLVVSGQRIEEAYANLVRKPYNPTNQALEEARHNLQTMLEVAQDLRASDYQAGMGEQFGELQVAIAKAQTYLNEEEVSFEDIMTVMDAFKSATTGLKVQNVSQPAASPPVAQPTISSTARPAIVNPPAIQAPDWSQIYQLVQEISVLNPVDYTPESYSALLSQLESVKALIGHQDLTQVTINNLAGNLRASFSSLQFRPTAPSVYENALSEPTPNSQTPVTTEQLPTPDIKPSLLMSMMAGIYAGLATYRRSRFEAKQQRK